MALCCCDALYQMVCSSSSAASQMVSALSRRHSWCVSGTPISNRLKDLQGLLDFVQWEPFVIGRAFSGILSQYDARTSTGLSIMRSIVATIMWRHRKAHVEHEIVLPPCTVVDEVSPCLWRCDGPCMDVCVCVCMCVYVRAPSLACCVF